MFDDVCLPSNVVVFAVLIMLLTMVLAVSSACEELSGALADGSCLELWSVVLMLLVWGLVHGPGFGLPVGCRFTLRSEVVAVCLRALQ